MNQYFATFPAGTWTIISKRLKSFKIDELKIIENDDSSVLFASPLTQERLIELRFFTNVYLVIDDLAHLPKAAIKGKYYQLMMLKDGEPQPIDSVERAGLQEQIVKILGLISNGRLSRNDFYLIERASGKKIFTLRLARAKFKRAKLSAGELRPELAHILCLAAGVKAKDTVLDMFAGYGSIPSEAVSGFGCKRVIAVDNQELPNRHEEPSISWHKADAGRLDFIEDDSIDRIVTDPPWGIYDSEIKLPSLYKAFIKEVQRVLKPGGIIVILTGYNGAEKEFSKASRLKIIGRWNILVSGKKATIFKLQKSA